MHGSTFCSEQNAGDACVMGNLREFIAISFIHTLTECTNLCDTHCNEQLKMHFFQDRCQSQVESTYPQTQLTEWDPWGYSKGAIRFDDTTLYLPALSRLVTKRKWN